MHVLITKYMNTCVISLMYFLLLLHFFLKVLKYVVYEAPERSNDIVRLSVMNGFIMIFNKHVTFDLYIRYLKGNIRATSRVLSDWRLEYTVAF